MDDKKYVIVTTVTTFSHIYAISLEDLQNKVGSFINEYEDKNELLVNQIVEYSNNPELTPVTVEEVRFALLNLDSIDGEKNYFPKIIDNPQIDQIYKDVVLPSLDRAAKVEENVEVDKSKEKELESIPKDVLTHLSGVINASSMGEIRVIDVPSEGGEGSPQGSQGIGKGKGVLQ